MQRASRTRKRPFSSSLAAENHVFAPRIDPEATRRVRLHLQRRWPLQPRVLGPGRREKLVRAHVGHHELVARNKSDAIDPRGRLCPPTLSGTSVMK